MNFEIQDYQRREEEARVNRSVPRSCPTADAYRDFQITNGTVEEDAIGGLYERHFLFNYLPGHSFNSGPVPTFEPKSWHGSPMATLMRTFLVHGSAVAGLNVISGEHRALLRELQDLYLRADPTITASEEENPREAGPSAIQVGRSDLNGAGASISGNGNRSRPVIKTLAPHDSKKRLEASLPEHEPPTKKRTQSVSNQQSWRWGPGSSSSNKVTWYPRMMGWNK